MEKISWTDRVRNEVLHKFKEERNILHMYNNTKKRLVTSCVEIAFCYELLRER